MQIPRRQSNNSIEIEIAKFVIKVYFCLLKFFMKTCKNRETFTANLNFNSNTQIEDESCKYLGDSLKTLFKIISLNLNLE